MYAGISMRACGALYRTPEYDVHRPDYREVRDVGEVVEHDPIDRAGVRPDPAVELDEGHEIRYVHGRNWIAPQVATLVVAWPEAQVHGSTLSRLETVARAEHPRSHAYLFTPLVALRSHSLPKLTMLAISTNASSSMVSSYLPIIHASLIIVLNINNLAGIHSTFVTTILVCTFAPLISMIFL